MKQKIILKLFVLVLLLFQAGFAIASTLSDIRVSELVSHARIVFDLTSVAKYHAFVLRNPDRVVVDIVGAKPAPAVAKIPKTKVIKDVRVARHGDGNLRVVFDLRQPMRFKIFSLHAEGAQPFRLVIDLSVSHVQGRALSTLKKSAKKKITNSKKNKKTPKPIVVVQQPKKLRNVVIVIDPGHGGKDPGATGQRGTHEKDVVLAISKDLRKLLNEQPGYKAVLTRDGDYFVALRGRLRIERHYHPDMFVAIHADAYKDTVARGASIFALSQHGATSEAARWLAQKENESELGATLSSLPYQSKMLRSVLISLAQTASISASLEIGDDMMHKLANVTPLHHGFVEQAGFVVLKEPDVPSLLVETGFISNANEELQLRDPAHQEAIARALMLGIKDYFTHHPPHDSYLAYNR